MRLVLFRKKVSESVVTGTMMITIGTVTMLQNMAGGTDIHCPGSNATIHAKCAMEVTFPNVDCVTVKDEIKHRILGDGGWLDPHNHGMYMLLGETNDDDDNGEGNVSTLTASRLTSDKKYTDLFVFTFSPGADDDGRTNNADARCVVTACSESQVTSILDFSTNYCNLHNLYCNTDDGCPIVEHDLTYMERYTSCRQRDVTKCLSSRVVADQDTSSSL